MRKFKGILKTEHKLDNPWIESDSIYHMGFNTYLWDTEKDGWMLIEDSTLCEGTGLKDRNNVSIYENDIIVIAGSENEYKVRYNKNTCMYECCNENDIHVVGININTVPVLEVVGNVWDSFGGE